jgi:hypothetical protein
MGNQTFRDVAIPLLWGSRAVLQDKSGRLSVIDLTGDVARLEVLADRPAPGLTFYPRIEGFTILSSDGTELYDYLPEEKRLASRSLGLPDCQVLKDKIIVGGSTFMSNSIVSSGVGIAVTPSGFSVGGPLPHSLARLAIPAI